MKQALLILCLLLAVTMGCAAPAALVTAGKSDYVIYHSQDAPASVKLAATELQSYLEKVTGARLAVVTEPREPMVSIGANTASQAAKVDLKDVPLEGFRIAVRGRNIYILGPDTADGQTTPQGGTSAGTLNGAYAFIERFLGVRWLMAGPHGDYVPAMQSVTIPDQDIKDAPFFINRRVPYTQERTEASKQWWARQRLGYSLLLSHGHNWTAIPTSAFKEHPEWFAEIGGTRTPPSGTYKLCATDKGMIEAFAQAAIKHFDENPQSTCYSLSPSDGGGWCQCARCKALYETDPNGEVSVTPAIIQFYNGVAEIVAKKYPEKVLAGYVYAAYVYPPSKPFKLAQNMFLVWAPSFDYGFTLYRPALQQRWDDLAPQWMKVTENISFYDLPNCTHNELGAPNPPGLEILEFLYPRLKKHGFKGVYVYGSPAWGYAGPMNYLLAKLAWNPDINIRATFSEYIEKCYAQGAEEMKQFYLLLDDETKRYFIENEKESYVLSEGRLRDVYGKNFPELERLYRAAEAKITDPEAKARLAMMGDNLTVLHWNLRQSKILAEPEKSSFYLPDKDFFAFMKANAGSLALAQPSAPARVAGPDGNLTVKAAAVPAADNYPVKPFLLRGAQRLIVAPTGDADAKVSFSSITARGGLVKYQVYDAKGALSDQGVVSTEAPVVLPADGTPFYQVLISRGSHTLQAAVENGAWAVYGLTDDKGLHLLNRMTPLHFEVAEETQKFTLWIAAEAPGETAAATLYAPNGRKATTFDCTKQAVDMQEVAVGAGEAGWWTLVLEKPETGTVDDVWVKPVEGLSGFFSINPAAALEVHRETK